MSMIVIIPVALVLSVVPDVTVAFKLKVSFGSSILSSLIVKLTVALVLPAGIVNVPV